MTASRFLLPLAAATVSLGLAYAPAALAMDNMQNSAMSKSTMSKGKMENSGMSKSHAMSKSKTKKMHKTSGKTHKMSDGKMSGAMKK